jgi:hypothetical protein
MTVLDIAQTTKDINEINATVRQALAGTALEPHVEALLAADPTEIEEAIEAIRA